jgi:hypothetical protein
MKLLIVVTIPVKDKEFLSILQETKQIIRIYLPVVTPGQIGLFAKANG